MLASNIMLLETEVAIVRKVRLGKTGIMVTKTAFGALPMQRVSMDRAKALLTRAYEAGINVVVSAGNDAFTTAIARRRSAIRSVM